MRTSWGGPNTQDSQSYVQDAGQPQFKLNSLCTEYTMAPATFEMAQPCDRHACTWEPKGLLLHGEQLLSIACLP